MRPRVPLMWLWAVFALAWPSAGSAQHAKDTLSYELTRAVISNMPGREGTIVVSFGTSLPARYLNGAEQTLAPAPEWAIELRDIDNPAHVTTVGVTSVFVPKDPAQNRLVVLTPAQELDQSTHQIRVQLLDANFPDVVLNQPRKQGAASFYGPAKGKDDADLYFKGLVVATTGSGPAYSIDAKAGYTRGLGSRGGSLGVTGTYVVDKASDIGPDTITASVTYDKVFVWGPATGLVLDVDPIGFELDSGKDTRNVRSAALGQFVFPSARLGPKSYATGDVLAGFEGGHNDTSTVSANSLGGFWRTVFGASGYLLLQGTPIAPRIDVTASWKVRLLAQDEPFTDARHGTQVTELTDKARHIVTVNAALMINKALGFSIGYRHGSEPPAYKNVRHRAEIGLVLKLKQIDKG
jgi:hypothetical protein